MAATVSTPEVALGNVRTAFATVTMDSSYATGGETVTPTQLGLSTVRNAMVNIKTVGGTVNVASATYDVANQKVKVYDETPAEVASTADLSTLVLNIVAWGI